MNLDWLPQVMLVALAGIGWAEIRSLRSTRHEHNNRLVAVELGVKNMQDDVTDLKRGQERVTDMVGEIRDDLLGRGVIGTH